MRGFSAKIQDFWVAEFQKDLRVCAVEIKNHGRSSAKEPYFWKTNIPKD